ncbi:MAG: leucine-rich repeat domain-containing protein, partial [Mycoplasmataceae bacterium]|nr:leucine-rich repeat domain-containing protein [Mycoplasmataceae bacterium]
TYAMIDNITLSGNYKKVKNGTAGIAWASADTPDGTPNSTSIFDAGCLAAGDLGLWSNYVTSIGYGAFDGCASITSINLGTTPILVGNYAFYGCASINNFYFNN